MTRRGCPLDSLREASRARGGGAGRTRPARVWAPPAFRFSAGSCRKSAVVPGVRPSSPSYAGGRAAFPQVAFSGRGAYRARWPADAPIVGHYRIFVTGSASFSKRGPVNPGPLGGFASRLRDRPQPARPEGRPFRPIERDFAGAGWRRWPGLLRTCLGGTRNGRFSFSGRFVSQKCGCVQRGEGVAALRPRPHRLEQDEMLFPAILDEADAARGVGSASNGAGVLKSAG